MNQTSDFERDPETLTSRDSETSSSAPSTSTSHSGEPLVKTERELQFYREMFSQLLDIVDAITAQIFDKVSVIPYSIRQFCKCLYQMTIDKFGRDKVKYEDAVRLVAHYLLKEWLLKACFVNLHIEGLTKEFYLG